ncbi:Hypothetical_protein [Hexamita inflata]|uniref:Hypothetical_protein n=1 Tax=Hexamita inflata TaxID=28002 RepID=A0AA86VRM6_9EUKA|nr:Hypothetical protein HINF_LOCUS62373 [Hexamita inflata]
MSYIGGICGIQSNISEILNCYVLNSFINGSQSGGISGGKRNNSQIISCKSENNTIISISYAGCIIANSSVFTQMQNSSSINCSVTSTTSVTGGIFGISGSVIIDSCKVNWLNTMSWSWSGGIIGTTMLNGSIQIYNVSVQNIVLFCINGNSVGGIIGYLYTDSIINGAYIQNIYIIGRMVLVVQQDVLLQAFKQQIAQLTI